jgi:hypothetical protein
MGSIFEIECGSAPPSTISFKSLSGAVVDAVMPKRDKSKEATHGVSAKDLCQTFQRTMGLEFEQLERTPFRPQVENHPGKFRSFREALNSKKSDFQAFSPQLQLFIFSNWPLLNSGDSSIIKHAPRTETRTASESKIPVYPPSLHGIKPSESVPGITQGPKMCVFSPYCIFSVMRCFANLFSSKESDPRILHPSISPAASSSVKVSKPSLPISIFAKPKVLPPVNPVLISPSPGPETPPSFQQPFTPITPPLFHLGERTTAISSLPPLNDSSRMDTVPPRIALEIDSATEMEDFTKPTPPISFLLKPSNSSSRADRIELAVQLPAFQQNIPFLEPRTVKPGELELQMYFFASQSITLNVFFSLPFCTEISMKY